MRPAVYHGVVVAHRAGGYSARCGRCAARLVPVPLRSQALTLLAIHDDARHA